MMDVLLFPILLGALLSVVFCGVFFRKRRPPLWLAFGIATIIGIVCIFAELGTSIFRSSFWTDNPVSDVPIAVVFIYFGLFALPTLGTALIVVGLYRTRRAQ